MSVENDLIDEAGNLTRASLLHEDEFDADMLREGEEGLPETMEESSETKEKTEEEVNDEVNNLTTDAEGEDEEEEDIKEIKFFVKTPAGKEFSLKQDELATVLDVKQTLVKMNDTMTEVNEIKLIFKGKPITDNNKTLKDLGIKEGARLHMIKQLYGAQTNTMKKIGPTIERTNQGDRGFIHITIPQGARPGNRLIIHPPGRRRMIVYVPRGHGPGDQLRVQLPDENGQHTEENANTQNTNATENATSSNPTPNAQNGTQANTNPTGEKLPPSAILQATCPENAIPGQEVLVRIPGMGMMKVAIPPQAQPGEAFFFRVAPII